MIYNRIVFLLIIIISNSYSNNLENFYELLDQSSVVKLDISITQNQFEKKYKSFGYFFILGSNKYYYESPEMKIHANSDNIITKNYINKQVIYNDLNERQLNLFDILSGNQKFIEFFESKVNFSRYDFSIPSMGFKGHFSFEPDSGQLKLIFLQVALNQSVSINIDKIEIIDKYTPKIEIEDFEVIDLRG